MELIVLNIGLDLGVISSTLFAMMVVMALVTRGRNGPVLQSLIPTTSTAGRQPVFDPEPRPDRVHVGGNLQTDNRMDRRPAVVRASLQNGRDRLQKH